MARPQKRGVAQICEDIKTLTQEERDQLYTKLGVTRRINKLMGEQIKLQTEQLEHLLQIKHLLKMHMKDHQTIAALQAECDRLRYRKPMSKETIDQIRQVLELQRSGKTYPQIHLETGYSLSGVKKLLQMGRTLERFEAIDAESLEL